MNLNITTNLEDANQSNSKFSLFIFFFAVLIVTFVIDQATKGVILQHFDYGDHRDVIPGLFALTLTFNKGAAFGIFSTIETAWIRHLVLASTSIVALTAVAMVVFRDFCKHWWSYVALGLILGGAIGNGVDRFRFDGVVDFIDIYWRQYHWPAFNMADTCICCGVALLLVGSYLEPRPSKHH